MKRFMNWLTNSFTPTMNKFSQKPVVAALSSSMQKIIPFILTGSCIHLYNVLRSYIPTLPNFIRIINFLSLIHIFAADSGRMRPAGLAGIQRGTGRLRLRYVAERHAVYRSQIE